MDWNSFLGKRVNVTSIGDRYLTREEYFTLLGANNNGVFLGPPVEAGAPGNDFFLPWGKVAKIALSKYQTMAEIRAP